VIRVWQFLVWLGRLLLLGRTAPAEGGDDWAVYKPEQRQIYKYWDGTAWVLADPLVIYQRMAAVGPELYIDMKLSESISKDAHLGRKNLLAKIRKIFDLAEYADGKGLTQAETVALLHHFIVYCEYVKKNYSPSPTSAAAPSPSTPPPASADAAPATPTSSPSGSSDAEPSTAPQEPSPTAQA
jgi:hypothetical protein